jgi:collagenase-like PrtC family protease
MNLSVAANWDRQLLANLKNFPGVHSLYGKLDSDLTGGGRPSYLLPRVDREYVHDYVKEARQMGVKFVYLMNPQCLDNLEYTAEFQDRISEELQWLSQIGVDYVTVSIPYLLEIIKTRFPGLKIFVSAFANVDSTQKAKFFEDLGADVITLPEYVNRDFRLLRNIKQSVSCEIHLVANMVCLYGCPFQLYHANVASHASQAGHSSRGFCPGYCTLNCTKTKISRPGEIVKSRWIRPEDTHIYEEIGIDGFKIIERFDTTETLTLTVQAYSEQEYRGNLADILNIKTSSERQLPVNADYFSQPDFVDTRRLRDLEDTLYLTGQYIDNQALDGFIEFFKNRDCYASSCDECGYCQSIADKAIKIDPDKAARSIEKIDRKLNDLIAGKLFEGVLKRKAAAVDGEDIRWRENVYQVFQEIIRAVPWEYRDISGKVISLKAESLARERKSVLVEEEDMVHAFISETPTTFHRRMMADLKRLIINIDRYL